MPDAGELIEGSPQALLRGERSCDVTAEALLQLVVRRLVGIGRRWAADAAAGRASRGGTGRRVGRAGAWYLDRKESADKARGDDESLHPRALRKPSIAVAAPSTRPAVITAASTYCTAVASTPGSTCT